MKNKLLKSIVEQLEQVCEDFVITIANTEKQ